ncbi:MAG TPA: hypothetical protein VJO35_06490 [Terriglobales bacterium]|nr:hypothetical protein [Terriglobales bacterium]
MLKYFRKNDYIEQTLLNFPNVLKQKARVWHTFGENSRVLDGRKM